MEIYGQDKKVKESEETEEKINVTVWSEEGKKGFREECEKINYEKEEINEMRSEMVEKFN